MISATRGYNRLPMKARLLQRVLPHIRPAFVAALVKRAFHIKRMPFATDEGTFALDPISNLGCALTGGSGYEQQMVQTLKACLKPGDVFVDLGANEGYFTVIAGGLVGHAGRVIAIEPQPRLQTVIRQNISLNGIADRVTICQVAVGDEAGTADFFLTSDLNTGASGFVRRTRYPLRSVKVPMLTLAGLLARNDIPFVDFLKVDVEGSEYEAVLGSREVFREHRVKMIALELHASILQQRHLDPESICRFLEGCGYSRDCRFENLVYRVPS